jgi:integrase
MKQTGKLTKRSVEAIAIPPKGEQAELWDTDLGGLHVRVMPTGRRVYRLKYRSAGRQVIVTLGEHGPITAEQARERARTLVGAVAEGRDPAAERKAAAVAAAEERRRAVTLADLVERWLVEGVDAAPNKRQSSWDTDARKLRNHIVPLLGKIPVRNLTKDDIAKAQRAIADGKTARDAKTRLRGRSIVTGGAGVARSAIMSLSACLSWAVDQEIIAANPVARVKKLPKRTMERFLSEAEAARLLDTLNAMEAEGAVQRVHADVVKVLLLTGARRSEIANLRWDEVDLGRGVLTLAPGRHKAGGAHGVKHIALNAPAAAVIAERSRKGAFVFPAPLAEKKGCDAGLGKAWERIRARADLQDMRLHDLRHSFASFGAAGGASLLLIGKALGHSQAATTARYAHLGNDPVRDLAEKVGARIMGSTGRKEMASGDVVELRGRKKDKGESG